MKTKPTPDVIAFSGEIKANLESAQAAVLSFLAGHAKRTQELENFTKKRAQLEAFLQGDFNALEDVCDRGIQGGVCADRRRCNLARSFSRQVGQMEWVKSANTCA